MRLTVGKRGSRPDFCGVQNDAGLDCDNPNQFLIAEITCRIIIAVEMESLFTI